MFFKKASKKSRRGFTLLETLVACGLFGIAGIAVASIYLYSTRAFAAMANYGALDQNNRVAMDKLTREIRESRLIQSATSNSTSATITILNGVGNTVNYTFDSKAKTLSRTCVQEPPPYTQVLIPNCSVMAFDIRQRTASNGVFDNFPQVGSNDAIQVINLTWKSWKAIPGTSTNIGTSEEIQSAFVVVRNQHAVQGGEVVFSE